MTSKKSTRNRSGNPPPHSPKSPKSNMKYVMVFAVIIVALIAAITLLYLNSNNDGNENGDTPVDNPIAVIDTSMGTIKVELNVDKAPITANNFITHAKNGYYNGVIFHRVMPNFMIQGGDPKGDGTGGHAAEYHEGYGDPDNKETWVIPDEFHPDLDNARGTISMANHGPDTGGSQFFINVVDNLYLDYDVEDQFDAQHAVFGTVIEEMDVADAISEVDTGSDTKPEVDVVINSITIEE